jgi:threonyl-tRNA synthetase
VQRCLDFGFAIYDMFGFEPRSSCRRGRRSVWARRTVGPREAALTKALEDQGLDYE